MLAPCHKEFLPRPGISTLYTRWFRPFAWVNSFLWLGWWYHYDLYKWWGWSYIITVNLLHRDAGLRESCGVKNEGPWNLKKRWQAAEQSIDQDVVKEVCVLPWEIISKSYNQNSAPPTRLTGKFLSGTPCSFVYTYLIFIANQDSGPKRSTANHLDNVASDVTEVWTGLVITSCGGTAILITTPGSLIYIPVLKLEYLSPRGMK